MIPLRFKRYFWDSDFDKIDAKKDSLFIIGRILEYGNREAIIWMIKNFKKAELKQVLLKRRGFSQKSANYWAHIFNIPKNKILCLKKSYQKMQKTHWSF